MLKISIYYIKSYIYKTKLYIFFDEILLLEYKKIMQFKTAISIAIMKLIELFIAPFFYNKNITILTGADSSHFNSMLQLINSVKIFNGKSAKIICYDLGLEEFEILKFNKLFPDIELISFNYADYPEFYNIKINAGQYAWKSAIFNEEFKNIKKNDFVIWLDAGCFVVKRLNIVKFNLLIFGSYSPHSQMPISELTSELTINALGLSSLKHFPMLLAGIVGLKKTKKNTNLILDWSSCSRQREIIAPIGSNRLNHRQDQSVFSLLFYKYYRVSLFQRFIKRNWEVFPQRDIG
jgi:hypothetical protein